MTRYLFGGVADYVISKGTDNVATLVPNTAVTCWNQPNGGVQYTDLVDTDGTTPLTSLSTDANGAIPEFYGPDSVTALYLDANGGSGPRRRTLATSVGDNVDQFSTELAAHEAATNPHNVTLSELSDVYSPTVTNLMAQTPFYVAHRGSGSEFPEHTLAAYESVVAAGAKAVEVSVHTTADGVPVCFHDTTLDRMTDHTGPVADWTYQQLREAVRVDARGMLGAGWSLQPIPTLEEVMQFLYGKCVIMLEAKSNASIPIVQDYLTSRWPGAQSSVIWKNYYASNSFPWAKANGFTTWGYFFAGDNVTDAQLDAVDANVDIWGPEHLETDARLSEIVARNKPCIGHVLHRKSDVSRLVGLGIHGIMCSRLVYNTASNLAGGVDKFASQVTAPGYIGVDENNPDFALKFDGQGGAYITQVPNQACLMGRHVAPADSGYVIKFSLKWDAIPSTTSLHSDIAFGKADDDKFQYFATTNSPGYSAYFRANGDMQLYTHVAGSSTSTQLGTVSTEQPVAGQYMNFEIEVSATQVILRRTDTASTYTLAVNDTQYRGRYWHVSVGSINSLTNKPTWSSISVTTV